MQNAFFDGSVVSPLTSELAASDSIAHLQDVELRRAINHHRRAISALEGCSFEQLSSATVRSLLERLQENLRAFEQEFCRRDELESGMA